MKKLRHLDQYFGVWAMNGPRLTALVDFVRPQIKSHLAAVSMDDGGDMPNTEPPEPLYTVVDGVACIDIVGVMLKYGSSFGDCCAMVESRRAIRLASRAPDVSSILLRFDTPGGSAMGVDDLAEDIAAASKLKPVCSYIEDMCASAGYYAASQASRIIANKSAFIGSIGTYAVIEDWSKAYETAGVKVHLVTSGQFKGAGAEGTPITPEQLAVWQEEINKFADLFCGAVARGRNMSREAVNKLADGRMWRADEAVTNGLIDEVGTIDAALASLKSNVPAAAGMGVFVMDPKKNILAAEQEDAEALANETAASTDDATQTETTAADDGTTSEPAANYKQLKGLLPEASAEFITKALDQEWSAAKATAEYSRESAAQLKALAARVDALEHGGKAVAYTPGRSSAVVVSESDAELRKRYEAQKNSGAIPKDESFETFCDMEKRIDAAFSR